MKIRKLTTEELIVLACKVDTYVPSCGPNIRVLVAEVLRLRRKLAVQKASPLGIAVGPKAQVMKVVTTWDVPEPESCPAPSSEKASRTEPDPGRSLHPEGGPLSD